MFLTGQPDRGRDRFGDAAAHSHVAALRAYWEGLRAADALPSRDQVDPRGLITALSHVFLIERQSAGLVRFRLAGRALCDLVGQELRGGPVEMMFETDSRPRLAAQLETVFTGPCALDAGLRAPSTGLMRPAAAARMIVLPLLSGKGQTSLAIGCVDMDVPPGLPPRRLVLERVLREPLAQGDRPAAAPPPRGRPALRLITS